jgi:predicted subunit of tRNA(5-methylaminomethyl-2-thiouridylate) methyltransferase
MRERSSINPEAWVLLSGGIDSTACAAFYLSQDFQVHAVFVDYGQVAARREADAAKAVAMGLSSSTCSVYQKLLITRDIGRQRYGCIIEEPQFGAFSSCPPGQIVQTALG